VTHENFRQWVIEDNFCHGRPDWDKVGAQFSDDVHGYEMQKIRILNAGHQCFANIAELMDISAVADIMQHKTIRAFFRKVEMEEIVPLVVPVPGKTPGEYFELIDARFANPAISDTARRIAFDGSSRHPGMVIPTIREAVVAGTPVEGLALVEAAWCRQCFGTRENGAVIEPNDPFWDELVAVAKRAKTNPAVWLEMRQYYGDLAEKPVFADAFARWLNMIWADGVEAAMKAYLKG
jgi:mannitol 2-dehydrogenase